MLLSNCMPPNRNYVHRDIQRTSSGGEWRRGWKRIPNRYRYGTCAVKSHLNNTADTWICCTNLFGKLFERLIIIFANGFPQFILQQKNIEQIGWYLLYHYRVDSNIMYQYEKSREIRIQDDSPTCTYTRFFKFIVSTVPNNIIPI